MNIRLNSKSAKFVLPIVAVGSIVLLAWSGKVYLATRLGRTPVMQNLTFAARLDPGSAEYQWQLGRLLEYSPDSADPVAALSHLRRAVELSPYDPQAWLDLGSSYQFRGNLEEAENCLRRADFLAPHLPNIQWALGNFMLLRGDVDESLKHFKVVLEGTDRYNQVIFDTPWKASGDPAKILDELISRNPPSEFKYLYYLLGRHDYANSAGVWKRIATGPGIFRPEDASPYLDGLISARRPVEAWQVWSDMRARGLLRLRLHAQRSERRPKRRFRDAAA